MNKATASACVCKSNAHGLGRVTEQISTNHTKAFEPMLPGYYCRSTRSLVGPRSIPTRQGAADCNKFLTSYQKDI